MTQQQTNEIWNFHYSKDKSKLVFPDENLVRILSKLSVQSGKALDFGAGTGRHSFLLKSRGWEVTSLDYAINSLNKIKEMDPEISTIHVTNPPYNFENSEFDLIVSWGVLHYNSSEIISQIINEYKRILKSGGFIAGTLRADTDTHLSVKNGKINLQDLNSASAKLFNIEELKLLFKDFSNIEIGYMERTPLGKLEERICHWIFLVKK